MNIIRTFARLSLSRIVKFFKGVLLFFNAQHLLRRVEIWFHMRWKKKLKTHRGSQSKNTEIVFREIKTLVLYFCTCRSPWKIQKQEPTKYCSSNILSAIRLDNKFATWWTISLLSNEVSKEFFVTTESSSIIFANAFIRLSDKANTTSLLKPLLAQIGKNLVRKSNRLPASNVN